MAKLGIREMNYIKNEELLKEYLGLLNTRLVYSNNIIESDNIPIGELYNDKNVLVLNDNLLAFSILLKKVFSDEERPLTTDLIKGVANTINKHSVYIKEGYRNLGDDVKFEDEFPIEKSANIDEAMERLLDMYYKDWADLDIFTREALFNIEFLRIHPFEDGNGRTSRLLLNFNLLRQGHAPILMPEGIREEYFKARNRKDVEWIKNLFEEESAKELIVMDKIIDNYEEAKEEELKL